MTSATAQPTPAIPPRPSRSADTKDDGGPKIPPRPTKSRFDRSASPSIARFAQSPFNEGIPSRKPAHLSPHYQPSEEPIERSGSVELPSVGEEGREYGAMSDGFVDDKSQPSSPEHTKSVAADLKLHAPKPSLPPASAIKRVAAVTRTDSDRAAQFGIGRARNEDRPDSRDRAISRDGLKKKPSTSFSTTSDNGHQTDDDHGIPEIGQRVPMNPHLGDVQAPSPAPSEGPRHHSRKHSSRGLPPGSYGLHGHGVQPLDKLEKAYYQKHPEILKREENTPIHDRQNDFAMSSADLNKLVRDTTSRGAGLGTAEFRGTPTDEVAFQASDEFANRFSTSRSGSRARKSGEHRRSSSLAKVTSNTSTSDIGASMAIQDQVEEDDEVDEDDVIHVDDAKHAEYRSYGNESPDAEGEDHEYTAPILASDEVGKDPSRQLQRPAVHPTHDRRNDYDSDDAPSRPRSRPTSIHHAVSQPEIYMTPLEDVEEYEPLFPEEVKKERQRVETADENKHHHHFPSKDIWEDAPNSVHYTATVSTPDLPETEHHRIKSAGHMEDRAMTPAQLFAKQQEELAEKESKRRSGGSFMSLTAEHRPTWAAHQAHLKVERPASGPKFPSRDVWEDVPESQLQQTTVSSAPEEEETNPAIPSRPVKKGPESSDKSAPALPNRPKPRQSSGDDKPKPTVTEKPKPQIPARPTKSSAEVNEEESLKSKPPVPKRPMGGKIAALQSGFLNDLNQRLQLGPQGPKKEEPEPEAAVEEKEKIPLSDARKSRARGPQRRAPAKAAAAPVETPRFTLTISSSLSTWSINPDDGEVIVDDLSQKEAPEEVDVNDGPEQEKSTSEKADEVYATQEADVQPQPTSESAEAIPVVSEASEPREGVKVEDPSPADAEPQQAATDEPAQQQKTLASNTAGESILETTVEKKEDGDRVEPVRVDEDVKMS